MKRLGTCDGICGIQFQCELMVSNMIDEYEQIRYTTYGIRLITSSGDVLGEIPDISTQKNVVEDFIRLCHVYNVAAIHICDILEDYLE